MKTQTMARSLFASILILVLAACQPATLAPTTTTGPSTTVPQTSTAVPQTPTAAAEGEGAMESVTAFAEALREAGATVEIGGEIEQPFFPVAGQQLMVDGSELQVFEFADEDARTSISDTISETGSQIGSAIPEWVDPPHFWAGGRLIVLYVGQDQAIIDATTDVMGTPITQPGASTELPSQLVLDVQQFLGEQLGTTAQNVEIVSVEQVDWPDSCLGLGQANESCAAVITPGWRVLVRVDGREQEVRIDETATTIRLAASTDSLAGTQWELTSFGQTGSETPVVEGSAVTLEFGTDGQVTGFGGCNSYSGQYQMDGTGLSFGQLLSTERACADESMTQQEQVYLQALNSASAFERTSDRLTLTYDGGQLNFMEVPAAGMSEARVLGILEFQSEATQDVLTAPETVQAGEEFELTISTFGGGCEREGDASVLVMPDTATVMVYDFTAATQPDVACPAILKRLTHTVTMTFMEPGEMVIQVWGRRVGPDTPPTGVPTILEHRVTVES